MATPQSPFLLFENLAQTVMDRFPPPPWAVQDEEQQDRGPGAVRGIGVGVDEQLDHRGHAQQTERRQAGRQTEEQEDGQGVLAQCSQGGAKFG